ncbi:interferon-induced, double-stranded RNA-activated protein kinase isoform X2 [Cheilinus undulatus]|uniref:interferon-induced, double-stranded RNA-activated protein kinase isoform X2 n=1 Tax=Cheilinus undulatus TaxID=241271 RepID=UPI001BD5DBAA|nr:interferon-induced, double-stranded RNA-activated protein kinase isoform X2 [Cheilinus undulatus]
MEAGNFVAKLNEYVQKTGSKLSYEDVGSVGPDHIKTFTVRAVLNGKAYPDGVGKNKREAKHNAAKNTWRELFVDQSEVTGNTVEAPATPAHQPTPRTTNYISWLYEYSQSKRLDIKALEAIRPGAHSAFYFVVGGKTYPVATGKTKKDAKEEAAKLAYHKICGSKTTETGDEKSSVASSQQEEDLNQNLSTTGDKTKSSSVITTGSDFTVTNFIGLLNTYCQKAKRSHDIVLENRSGPPNNPQFYYKVVIDKKEYPIGEGKNVKEAKQNAAQLAWSALQEQSDFDSKLSLGSAVSDDSALARPSTPISVEESSDNKSKSVPTASSDSFIVFTDSPPPAKDQIRSPVGKSKIRIAANFQNVCRRSKEDMVNFNGKNEEDRPSEKPENQSVTSSKFTSEFDSIICLGKGGFGHVYKARQKLLDKNYAVKIVRCKKKALREAGALSDLNHCNIVRYYTCWLEDSGYQGESTADSCSSSQSTGSSAIMYLYIQMELCDSKTLRVWIDEKNMQNAKKSLKDLKRREESLTIAQQIINGVVYFHSMKFIHRDLKPANIMFGKDGEVKIGDFGLVTDENDDDAENLVERTVYKGTPPYMAPEQDRKTYDRKVDIFALGLIYFELLWHLSTAHERKEIWEDVRNQKFPDGFLKNFHLETQIIKSMLCVNPEERLEASQVKTELQECSRVLTALKESRHDNKTV